MNILNQYKKIIKNIEDYTYNFPINLIVVTKGRSLADIQKIINLGHIHFGENRVQESVNKWKDILNLNVNIKLHFIGKLQTNKVADAISNFSFIHSLDNDKLALKISLEEKKLKKTLSYFIQVNLGEENQKSGILKKDLPKFVNYCKNDLKLNIIGLMCIPPLITDPTNYFLELKKLAEINNLQEISMGMSNDFEKAIKCGATFVRLGSAIFNES